MKDQGHDSHSETVLGQESVVDACHEISSVLSYLDQVGHFYKFRCGCYADSAQDNEHPHYYSLTARMKMSEILDAAWREFSDFILVEDVRFYDRDYFCLWFAIIIRRHALGFGATGFFVRHNLFSDSARRKRVDIECGFEAEGKPICSCAILLRYVKDNNAFTGKMFRIYKDLHFLESLLEQGEGACGYSECRFYMLTPVEAFRKSYASCEDSSSFGLDLETDKYVRYHEQELFFKKTYPVSWYTRHGERSDVHFLEIDLNKIVDCIVGVYRGYDAIRMTHMESIRRPTEGGRGRYLFRAIDDVKDENCIVGVYDDDKCCRCLIYRLGIITGREYSDFLNGNSIYNIEAVFRLSEMPFAKAELQPWTVEKGKVLYVSDIRVRELASVAICDVLGDFLVIIAEKMGGNTLRVRIEDGKLIEYFSKSDMYRAVGKGEWCDSTGRSRVTYYYETETLDLLPDW